MALIGKNRATTEEGLANKCQELSCAKTTL
jgi:hypothetical protein